MQKLFFKISSKADIAEALAMGNSSTDTTATQQRKKNTLKISQKNPKKKLWDIKDILDPQINPVHKPQDDLKWWALGAAYKTVH